MGRRSFQITFSQGEEGEQELELKSLVFLKGVANFIRLQEQRIILEEFLENYRRTGIIADGKVLEFLLPSATLAARGFPGAEKLVNMDACAKTDETVKHIYQESIARHEENINLLKTLLKAM